MPALVVALPALLGGVLQLQLRWLLAIGLLLLGIWLSFAASDSGPDELPALATAMVALSLLCCGPLGRWPDASSAGRYGAGAEAGLRSDR